jgi:hypothetical protein
MEPIQTTYKGYKFRSRLEARWAVFLDDIGLVWEYEKDGYNLPSGPYLPDFYLTDWNCWVEVKGTYPTEEEKTKCEELHWETDKAVLLVYGLPGENESLIWCQEMDDGGGGLYCGEGLFSWYKIGRSQNIGFIVYDHRDRDFYSGQDYIPINWVIQSHTIPMVWNPQKSYDKAKQARFEHGEKP